MDELFRRAAEDYPLDTKSADWNKVLAALQGQTKDKNISGEKGNKNGRLLWLLLLLPLGLICNQLYSPGTPNKEGLSKASVQDEAVRSVVKNAEQNNNNNVVANSTTVAISKEKENTPGKNETVNSTGTSIIQDRETSFNSIKKDRIQRIGKSPVSYNNFGADRDLQIGIEKNGFTSEETLYSRTYVSGIAFSKTLGEVPPNNSTRKFDPLITSPEENSKRPIRVSRQKKFYVGLMSGVDASTVKFQKIENAGFTYGALIGYQINKKWSFETGIYSEKKYYYSDGKYFDRAKVKMPSTWKIEDATGDCKMFEIPISLKYNFSSRKNSGWFATVGTSSYFMKKENYAFKIYYGSIGPVSHVYTYKDSTKYFFSNLSFSAGYMHRLGNFADLRIEPYLKAPVSGVGVGKLPLLSTGLQVGLTKKF